MSSLPLTRNHVKGTKVMRRDGYTYIKTSNGWKAEHRMVASFKLLDRELFEGEKVFHKDNTLRGEEGFNDADNLVVVKFRTTKWIKLKQSRVLYVPKKNFKEYKDFVLK